MLKAWETVREGVVLYKVEEFANKIIKLGEDYQIELITSWGGKLLSHVADFDTQAVSTIVKGYPDIIKMILDAKNGWENDSTITS